MKGIEEIMYDLTWKIEENSFCASSIAKQQSLFTVGNGYLGLRGEFEEGYTGALADCTIPGVYINGFYEIGDIAYGEKAYGFPGHSQTMVNVCNGKSIETYLGDQRFHLDEGTIIHYHRELDMKKGIVARSMIWEAPDKKRISVDIEYLVSFTKKNIVAVTYSVTPLNFSGIVKIVTGINTKVYKPKKTDDPRIAEELENPFDIEKIEFTEYKGQRICNVNEKTVRTKLKLSCIASDWIDKAFDYEERAEEGYIGTEYSVHLKEKECLTLKRLISYGTGKGDEENAESIAGAALAEAAALGIQGLKKEQEIFLNDFWEYADVVIDGQEELTRAMRFNIFQLLQAVGRDGKSSICAKGLSGEGYGGHYFWESEVYILPVFLLNKPEIARKMLEYRYSILENARNQARLLGHRKGALYSWRSINGDECSAYFPAGSAQYHISADIALAVRRYYDATGDLVFLEKHGAEILIETARLWIDTGHFDEHRDNRFCIDEVTGPDEYTALVDNNCYTNFMARENLYNAVWAVETMRQLDGDKLERLLEKLEFQENELEEFKQAADRMYLPYDDKLRLYKQDDTFLDKKVLDLNSIPKENHPLLIYYHPLFIYRHQVCKQADLILAEFLLPDKFELEQKKRDYEYYERITTHDSSLSASVFSVMACEIGDTRKAYEYFLMTARTDLDDLQGNTKDGLHMANMAGTWSCVVNGFGGLRIIEGVAHLAPQVPKEWEGYKFSIRLMDKRLEVRVSAHEVLYHLTKGDTLVIWHKEKEIKLEKGNVYHVPLKESGLTV